MNTNNKLNLTLIIYALSAVFFQPLTITLQVAAMVYLAYIREWRILIYGIGLFAILIAIFYYISLHGFAEGDWVQTSVLVFGVLFNLIWFVAIIKVAKAKFMQEE